MREKLTKNDSMSKKCAEISGDFLGKKKDFDVLVAAFEALLKKENAHESFFKEWEKRFSYQGTANSFYAWRESIKDDIPYIWLKNAFVWSESEKGLDYWYEIHKEWLALLKRNLKK